MKCPVLQFKIIMNDLALKLKLRRALAAFSDLRPEMQKVGEFLVDDAGKRLAARTTDYAKFSSGRLLKSLRVHPFTQAVTVSSVQPYARTQQEGGTVKSKRPNGYLAIPLRDYDKKNHVWPRHWSTPLSVVKLRDGRLFLKSAKFGQLVYRLIQQVTIPARPYLVKSEALIDYMRKLIARKLDRL